MSEGRGETPGPCRVQLSMSATYCTTYGQKQTGKPAKSNIARARSRTSRFARSITAFEGCPPG
eukprot:10080064-Lingulodinium_polyedra.AAC.1